MNKQQLEKKSVEYRKKILKYIVGAKAGHTGGSLSCTDILNVLYNHTLKVSHRPLLRPTETGTFKARAIVWKLCL